MSKVTKLPRHDSETRTKILNALDLTTVELKLPRWDTTILVRGMAVAHPRYVAFVEAGSRPGKEVGPQESQARRNVGTVILCALDLGTGEQLFNWSDADDLREKHYNTVLTIASKAFELAGGDSPLEMKVTEALDLLTAYAMEEGWETDDMEHIGALRERLAAKITEEVEEALADADGETDEVASDSPLEDATA